MYDSTLNFINSIDTENLSDPYFNQIIQSIIDFVESGNLEGIKIQQKGKIFYYRITYRDGEGKRQRKEISITKAIKNYIKSWLSIEQATFQAKAEVLKECFNMRTQGLINLEEKRNNYNLKQLEEELLENGHIKGIVLEIADRYEKFTICVRLRKVLNGKLKTTSLKIGLIEETGMYRNLELTLKEVIKNLISMSGISDTDENINNFIERIIGETLPYYNMRYDELFSRSVPQYKNAA